MDTLSHIVLGACIGEAMLGKKIGKKAMLWGAVTANLPDADVFVAPFFHPVDALMVHRGITHSLLFVFLAAPLLGWILFKRSAQSNAAFKNWTWMSFVALLSHPLLDSCTVYGTGIFEPFSDYRLQFTSLFIIDPFYTLPLLAAALALLILKRDSVRRRFWWKFGIYLSTGYLFLTIGNKLYMEKVFSSELKEQNISVSDQITSPTALNNVLWNVVAKDSSGYWIGFYSHLDTGRNILFSFIPRSDSIAGDLLHYEAVQKLIGFSNGYYCFTQCHDTIHFNDLRFAFAGQFSCGPQDLIAGRHIFVFSFGMKKDSLAPYGIHFERNAWSRNRFEGFSNLVKRIKGI